MAVDLDYAPVVGRFGITVGDLPAIDVDADVDVNPDVLWCDEGTVTLVPLVTQMKVTGDPTVGPFMAGNAPIETVIDADTGRMTYNGSDTTWVLDLGSDKVNPRFDRDVASYRVEFKGMRCRGVDVKFTDFTFHAKPLSVLAEEGKTVNDLALVSPVPATGGTPIVRGPGVVSAAVNGDGELLLTLETGEEVNAGELPVGPGGSAAGVASYLVPGTVVDQALGALTDDPESEFRIKQNTAIEGQAPPLIRREKALLPVATVTKQIPARPVARTYRPAATETATTSGTSVAIDATNLSISFVCPPSGRVRVKLNAVGQADASTGLVWALRDANGQVKDSEAAAIIYDSVARNYRPVSTEVEVSTDGGWDPLVPGKTYTFQWAHYSTGGPNVKTCYGGGFGTASMEVIPISALITERPTTVTVNATPTHRPLWLCHDQQTLLGASMTETKIGWSLNDGTSWTTHSHVFDQGVAWIRQLDNGEIACFTGQGALGGAWVSSGWPADKAAATFTKTLTYSGGPTAHPGPWSVDTYGPYVLAAEYGPKNGAGDMARYVFFSKDYGLTWETIFDLGTARAATAGHHLHGVCYDPYWDAIWVCGGDNYPLNGVWVSFDHGDTWTDLSEKLPNTNRQFTTVVAIPEGVIFVTDAVADGIWRMPRETPDAIRFEGAVGIGVNSTDFIDIVGTSAFRNRRGGPLLLAMNAAGGNTVEVPGPGRVYATYDGYTFKEVFTDTATYLDKGVQIMVGPTLTGKYHAFIQRGSAAADYKHAVVSLA